MSFEQSEEQEKKDAAWPNSEWKKNNNIYKIRREKWERMNGTENTTPSLKRSNHPNISHSFI